MIQNTTNRKVRNLFYLLEVFVSFSPNRIPKPVGLKTCVRISCGRSLFWEKKPFDGGKKEEKKEKKKENRAQKVRTDFLPRRPAAGRSLSCPFLGCAAIAPPPASIAAYCSRAAPSSDDAANTGWSDLTAKVYAEVYAVREHEAWDLATR